MRTTHSIFNGHSFLSGVRTSLLGTACGLLLSACATPGADVEKSETAVSAAATLSNDSSSLLRIADEMAADGAYGAAIPLYRRAHQQDTTAAAPLIGLGRSLAAAGQYLEAAEVFEKAHAQSPENADVARNLANTYIALGRPADALTILNGSLDQNPFDIDALGSRAVALDALGRHGEALATYQRALSTAPENEGIKHNYGLSLALGGDDQARALELLGDVASRPEATAAERQNLAMAYALGGDDVMAQRLLAIDSDQQTVENKLTYFDQLKALDTEQRFQTVMSGAIQPKKDLLESANRAYDTDNTVKNETVARLVEEPEPPVAEVVPEPEPEPVVVVEDDLSDIPLLSESQGWALQIAAYRKPQQLRDGWAILREKYADIIGDLEPRRSEVDFGDREKEPKGFFYRLNAGPLTSLAEALNACKEMHALGADCWVRPPEPTEGSLPE